MMFVYIPNVCILVSKRNKRVLVSWIANCDVCVFVT